MSNNRTPGDDLLERARRLEERSSSPSKDSSNTDVQDQIGWIARRVAGVRRVLAEARIVWNKCARFLGPLRPVFRYLGRAIKWSLLFVSCIKQPDGKRVLHSFSPKRLGSFVAGVAVLLIVMTALYVFGTRREGAFLINNFQLVSGETDVYQVGGCMKKFTEQTACAEGEAEIVLFRPAWIPGMGINPFSYEEEVGQIPVQGECDIGVYGWYLRGPSLTRGLLKPVSYKVGSCRATLLGQ